MNVAAGAVVSGSFQAFDQSYLLAALAALGPHFVGVTQLPVSASDAEILALDNAGVRALRFNLRRGGSHQLKTLGRMSRRVHELAGWHVELYVHGDDLPDLYARLCALPAISIDHLGLSAQGFPTLLELIQRGAHVKASGFGRVDFDLATALWAIDAANPHALMFGTDLPSTRAPRAYSDQDLGLIVNTLGEARAADVLCHNAVALYRPGARPSADVS
jgi:predicted TIM-barrel fold metal-dependent hydrolase